MKTAQARASVETLRDVQNDKALKTKAEKDRRIRKHFLSGIICSHLEKYPLLRLISSTAQTFHQLELAVLY